MKIDNILNKEKSPDKATIAERTASIEDIKKSQKFYEFNDLSSATNINNNLLQEQETIYDYLPPTTSKLKKLLLNNEHPEANNLSEFLGAKSLVATTKNNHKRNNNVATTVKKNAKNANKQKLFLCSECDEYFHKLHLFNHIKSVHNKFTCLYCYGFFVDVESLEKHLVKKHKVQNTSFFDEVSLQNFLSPGTGLTTKSVKAVCCKCATIFSIVDANFHSHSCGNIEEVKAVEVPVVIELQQNSHPPETTLDPAKEDFYCDQAIQKWCQPNFKPQPSPVEQLETSSQIENALEKVEEKLVVPKLTLKIPKAFQQQQYDNVESEEDSGDEGSSSEEDNERCDSKLSTANDFPGGCSSSLSDTDNEVVAPLEPEKKPENMPSLKLKIKNLASNNPESVLENFPQETTEVQNDVDMTECPMDLEPTKDVEETLKPTLIVIDGAVITPANDDVQTVEISLDECLDKIPILKLMKICLKASIPCCLYCNHARKIVVNGKALAIHFITHHRFHAMVDSITAEELHPEKLVSKFEQSATELTDSLFNLETFDNQDEEKKEGHVTISHDKLYECFQCRFQTPIHKELYLHNRKMHQKSMVNCLMCKMSFYSYSELLCHICPGVANKQVFLDYKFYCCLCNMDNIPSAFRLMVHLRKKHYACDVCLEKCSDQCKLSSHVWKHKLFHLCYRCNICYRNKADIMKHLFWKHGTEGVECKKCLQKKWPHVYHFCIPPAAFTCTTCEVSFSRAMALNVHMRIHEDGAKYACTEIGCEKKFVSRKLLLRHLDRHQHEITEREGETAKQECSVMIPAEVPEGCCMRTMPIVFKRFTKKPTLRKLEDEVKTEVKPEQETKKEEKDAKTLPDLPETNLNLSESSESDSSDDEQSAANQRSIETLAALVEAQIENAVDEEEKSTSLTKVSTLSDSDEDEETEVKKEAEIKKEDASEVVEKVKTEEVPAEQEIKEVKEPEEVEDRLPENPVLHVCQSDHDYANLNAPPSGSTKEDLEKLGKLAKIEKQKKKLARAEAKKNRVSDPNNDFSSSSESSGSSSSSSSSSSGSSSSSSGSSSDSSSSEASATNKEKARNKKFSKKRAKKEKKAKTETEAPEVPRDPDDIIYESDLVTDETDTDEDFYDEHPLKLDSQILAEKRKQLLKGGVIDGIVENSRPSTPSLPPDEKIEKKMKKKRKKEHRKSSSPSKRPLNDSTATLNPENSSYFNSSLFSNPSETPQMNKLSYNFYQTSTPLSMKPQIELHQANQIRQLLQSTQQQPVLPILKDQHHYHSQASNDYVNVSHVPSIVSSATSTRQNSDSEQSNIKRSQRKRIPNKFYGYTSDDESMAAQLLANVSDPFKPIPPPNLTWRKEDLPTKNNKSPSSTPRIAPLKLNLGGGDQLQQQLHTFAVEHKRAPSPQMYDYNYEPTPVASQTMPTILPQHNSATMQSDSDSSDGDQLHISEPRRRKRKLPSQANSMYAFHTLETPPTVIQPPIPRLKLTIGSNNKIRRRNINPLKVSAAKKRKLNPAAKKNVVAPPPVVEARGTFNPYAKQYDLQPPMRLLQSPTFDQSLGQEAAMSSRQMLAQEKHDKQQKLEEAIMNTQQYFQRFNHTQVTSAEVAQENADGDGRVYCYCRRPYDELQGMIGCDGSSCQIEWFHFECVGILVPPKGNWYCPECQKGQPPL